MINELHGVSVVAGDNSPSEDRHDPRVGGRCCRRHHWASVQPGDHLAGRGYLRERHVPRGD